MSSVPPNMPPGGGQPPYPPPPPPYDPQQQYRAYREQQKAAWRAQRDAWKAQQHAWKANYINTYGPRVPSLVGPILLIGIGIVALLIITGHLGSVPFWTWYSHWWPLLLIGAGLAMLGEWALDMHRHTPIRRTGSFIGVLVLLVIVGLGASAWKHAWGPLRAQFGDEGANFFNAFGLPEHDADQQIQSAQVAPNASVYIENSRGDISVSAGDGNAVTVQAHQVAYANSDSEAKKIFDAEAAHLSGNGTSIQVKSDGSSSGRLNLTVTVPRQAHVTINSGKGDVTAATLGGGLTINAVHGDTHINNIVGSVQIHFGSGKHDFSAHQIAGDLVADGTSNDVTFSEIKGRLSITGEIFGEVHMESIGGPVNLHTSVTDLQLASLSGDLTLNSDDLRVTESKGTVHVVTHSKDVDLSGIQGDCYVEDRDGRIAVEPAGNFNVEAKNNKGDIELTLPPNASATVNGRTRNGDIMSEFSLATSGEETKVITGRIGSGQARITLSTDNGDLSIKRGSSMPAILSPAEPKTPAAPHSPRLKGSPREQQQKFVTQ